MTPATCFQNHSQWIKGQTRLRHTAITSIKLVIQILLVSPSFVGSNFLGHCIYMHGCSPITISSAPRNEKWSSITHVFAPLRSPPRHSRPSAPSSNVLPPDSKHNPPVEEGYIYCTVWAYCIYICICICIYIYIHCFPDTSKVIPLYEHKSPDVVTEVFTYLKGRMHHVL